MQALKLTARLSVLAVFLFLMAGSANAAVIMTDLGTLGGPNAYATVVNSVGQIAGNSTTADGYEHGFIWSNGVMTDLGTLGGSWSTAESLNSLGQVAGSSQTATGQYAAFIWQNGVMSEIEIPGSVRSFAYKINEAGQVAGIYYSAFDKISRGFLWDAGNIIDLGYAGRIIDLNDNGLVLFTEGERLKIRGGTLFWDDYASQKLIDESGGSVTGYDLNNRGMVTGILGDGITKGLREGFFADLNLSNVVTSLGSLGGSFSGGLALNDEGRVAGYSTTLEGYTHAIIWYQGVITDIDPLQERFSEALDINNSNQVVGDFSDASGMSQAFIWQDGVMTPLGSLPGSLYGSYAEMINDNGLVVGGSYDSNGYSRAVAWKKIATPEELIGSIDTGIENLFYDGILNNGQAQSFSSTLNTLNKAIASGNASASCGSVGALVNQLESAVKSGKLTQAQAQILLDGAKSLQNQVCSN